MKLIIDKLMVKSVVGKWYNLCLNVGEGQKIGAATDFSLEIGLHFQQRYKLNTYLISQKLHAKTFLPSCASVKLTKQFGLIFKYSNISRSA